MKLKTNLSIESQMQVYREQGFDEAQLDELLLCLKNDTDVSSIANIKYNPSLMRHMVRALQANIDISKCYVNSDLDIGMFIELLEEYARKGIIKDLTYGDVWALENYPYRKGFVHEIEK